MKKVLAALLAGALALSLAACSSGGAAASTTAAPAAPAATQAAAQEAAPAASTAGDPVKLGLFYEQTGDFAVNGERHYRAAKMVIDDLNAKGGILGRPVELVTADDSSTNAGAVTALEILMAEKVDALIGPGFSSMCLAVADPIKEAGIPAIVSGTSLALVAEGTPKNWFRNLPPDDIACANIAKFLTQKKGFKKIFVLYENSTFGNGNLEFITKSLKEYGVEPIGTAMFNGGDTDFTAQIMTAEAAKPEATIYFSASSADAAVLVRQSRELGVTYEIQGSMQFGSSVTFGLCGDAMEGIYAFQSYNKNSSELAGQFNDEYEKLYGEGADHFNGWVRDAILVVADAMERAGTTEYAAVVKALSETKDFPGVIGPMTCDERNELIHNVSIVHIEDGKYVVQDLS